MFLYGVPCMIFDGIMGDDEISIQKCLIAYLYTVTSCIASNGNGLNCIALATSTFLFPCMYRAINNPNDTDPPE